MIFPMFASNNKPSKRSTRSQARSSAAGRSASTSRRRADRSAESFDRSSYGARDAGHSSHPASSRSSYRAESYGSSTRRSPGAASRSSQPVRPAGGSPSRRSDSRSVVYAQRKRKAKRKRIALIALAVVAVVMLGGIGAAWAYIASVDNNLREDVDADLLNSLTVTDSPSDPFYMLLIGVDKSEARSSSGTFDGTFRTDSMILARIDPKEKEVTLVSVPRDTRVTLEGHGEQKINAAYAFGGASLAVDTVSELAGVPISHYAEIDFDGFKAVVDALGGVDVNVPMEINDSRAGGHVSAGQQTLNGEQALILCRSRHAYDDYGDGDALRAANQRMVLSAIMKKLMSSDVATMTNTVSTLAEYVTTDYSVSGIVGLAQSMVGMDVGKNMYTAQLPTTSVYENNIWWEIIDQAAWDTMIERVKQGLPPTEETTVDEATGVTTSTAGDGSSSEDSSSGDSSSVSLQGVKVSVKNGCGVTGAASEAASKLTPEGVIAETGNADDSNYASTIVVYDDDADKKKAERIVDLLGKGAVKKNTGTYSYSGDILVVLGSDWN